jgi:Protein of unknown function (DUF4231)
MSEVPVSKQYRHTVSELYRDRWENRITEQELNQRLDELGTEEVKNLEHLGPLLIKQVLESVEKDISEDQKKAFEEKARLEKLAQNQQRQKELTEQREREKKAWAEQKAKERKEQEEQKKQELEQQRQEQERLSFREETERHVFERDLSAKKIQRHYNILQVILLTFSAVTATMAGIDGIARWIVAITGLIATVAGGLLTTFKLQDRIYANHKAVAELRLECQKYDYHIDEYKDIGVAEAFIKFSRAVNLIQGEQMLQEVELWNPKRDERKKTRLEIQADQQEESEKAQNAEMLEERESEELPAEDGESDEKQLEVVPSSSEKVSRGNG